MPDPAPSSATSGFFQPKPQVISQAEEDEIFQRAISFFLPLDIQQQTRSEFSDWSQRVISPEVLNWIVNAEENPPSLRHQDTFGRSQAKLITSEGWRNLQALGLKQGTVATGYEGRFGIYDRVLQFLRIILWSPSSGLVTCPSAMQDGAAALLKKHIQEGKDLDTEEQALYQGVLHKLTSRDPAVAWTSGQWMTERAGGSDVRGTETRARPLTETESSEQQNLKSVDGGSLGNWWVDGYKWFSSATDADMTILLAKTPNSDNLSVFYAPIKRQRLINGHLVAEFNGINPQRLKNKLGTKALPTAELELKGMRAHQLGKKDVGVKQISTVLTLTRLHTAIGSIGYLGRGLAISRAFARVRRVGGGRLLLDVPVHVKSMAKEHVEYKAHTMLALFAVSMLGISEHAASVQQSSLVSSVEQARLFLRLLTPIAKALVSLAAVNGLRASMESLGGVGYLENNDDPELNIARIFRDANVMTIWEGTSNIMADDTIRVLTGREGQKVLDTLENWCRDFAAKAGSFDYQYRILLTELRRIKEQVATMDRSELQFHSPEIMESLGWFVAGTLLVQDALRDGNPIANEIALRWLAKKDARQQQKLSDRPWQETAMLDKSIVFGNDTPSVSKL
ncbi:Acyl-CoA dehydrogenase family member 11 [Lachnellula hyalina]|uniref:Acyl-CoA dehydrogenase family member 11 n=1 Tax=Lachnellula hyalina TaxID=1316788 RepID=A0A8H8R5V7_9HELO|nr:Acyl-CoA dehydrogenase family member 11 [Lachnellula hyalina]TVY28191.1 Acyl-CoA dehydrogenase family member 11 [Lachnellula hyalina]